MWSTPYVCQIFLKIESFQQIFKSTYVKFRENPSNWIRADGQLYGYAEANNRLSQFYEKRLERIASNIQLTNKKVLRFRIFVNNSNVTLQFYCHCARHAGYSVQTVTCNTSIKQKCVCVSVCVEDVIKNVENNAHKLIYLTNAHTHTYVYMYIYIYIYRYTTLNILSL
jgi:hypothetical protein